VKQRADFIIYWGGNPAECHPRHFTKYTIMQKSKFLPRGRKDRTMVLVDIRETKSAKAADIFLQVRPGKDFELITILRALLKDQPVRDEDIAETGLDRAAVEDLVRRMKGAKFGCIFFGMGLSMTRGKHMNSAALLTLAAEMNAFTKFVAMPMRGHGNVTGADVIMRWQTGYPFGISTGATRGTTRASSRRSTCWCGVIATPHSSSGPTRGPPCPSRRSITWPASPRLCSIRMSHTPAGWPACTSRPPRREFPPPGRPTAWTSCPCPSRRP
jgi:formylmethanofuran dehydrogenase subunit B